MTLSRKAWRLSVEEPSMRKMTRMVRTIVPCVLFALLAAAAAVAADLPKPQGDVNDFANVLPEAVRADVHALLQAVRQQTSAEIAVVTVESLEGTTVEDYATRLFQEWGIGKKG